MRKLIIITDLTRMQGNRVCVAGYDADGQCIRPVLPHTGISEQSLTVRGRPIVFPFALVEYDFLGHKPEPPHTEDWRYAPASVRLVKRADEAQKRAVLTASLFPSVAAIFEQPIQRDVGYYVLDGQGPRSLGTIQPRTIRAVTYEQHEGKWDYRLEFVDGGEVTYRLKVTDLAFRYNCNWQHRQGRSPTEISEALTAAFRSSTLYLRIGLARGWERFPERCYLQITGIHTFPDYLEGKTFADFGVAALAPPTITRLHHAQIIIPTGAEEAARQFYCGTLGLREIEKPASLQERGGFWVQVGEIQLHIGTDDGVDRNATKAHLAYEVSDLDAWRLRLKQFNVAIQESAPIPSYRRFEIRDPFGNRIEFIQQTGAGQV
jgi:catechol 2,3-dioxygenase-like lactoylglutathione lyase family enzyme